MNELSTILRKKFLISIMMKTPEQLSTENPYAELHAKTAIEKIQNWVANRYPSLAEIAKSQIIVECLIEIDEERKFISAQ